MAFKLVALLRFTPSQNLNFLQQMILKSRTSASTMECLPPGFYGGISKNKLAVNKCFPDVVQNGNHVVLLAGGCHDAAGLCAKSCEQKLSKINRTRVQKQSAESLWPVPYSVIRRHYKQLELETDFVHDAGETSKSSTGHRLPADCSHNSHTIVLQNFCLHDIAQNRAMFG